MKKEILSIALMLASVSMSAQTTLKAQSLYDVNQDDKVSISDVNTVVKKVVENASTDKTVVDTEALLEVLNALNDKIDALSTSLAKVKSKMGILDHDYVEIGGLKWATMNLGATTVAGDPATCYGDYYAWGETEPRYTSITISGENSVSFGGWSSTHSSGYSSSDYPTYTDETLDADHDAATQNWGSDWRTPTHEDYVKLYEACGGTGSYISSTLPIGTMTTTAKGIYWCNDYDGVKGLLFSDGTNKVFFPAAGRCNYTSFRDGGSYGDYWSSSLNTSNTNSAYYLYFYSSYVYPSNYYYRYSGRSVRPVSE